MNNLGLAGGKVGL